MLEFVCANGTVELTNQQSTNQFQKLELGSNDLMISPVYDKTDEWRFVWTGSDAERVFFQLTGNKFYVERFFLALSLFTSMFCTCKTHSRNI